MVTKSIVLSWIQHLQQGRSRISLIITAHLVHLIQEENRIAGTGFLKGFQDTTRHSSYIGTTMTANFRLIPHTTQRSSGKFPSQSSGHRASQRGFTYSRWTYQTKNRCILSLCQLTHSQILQNTLLYLLQTIVILVKNLLSTLNIINVLGLNFPRQAQKVIHIGADNCSLLGGALRALQPF